MRRATLWLPAAVALTLVSGCANTTEANTAAGPTSTAATTTSPPTPWDLCTIPDAAIERAGLITDTKESGVFGRDQNGFTICGWEGPSNESRYFFAIFAGFARIDFIDDPGYFDETADTDAQNSANITALAPGR